MQQAKNKDEHARDVPFQVCIQYKSCIRTTHKAKAFAEMPTPALRPGFKSAATEGNENFTCSVCKLEADLMCPCNIRLYYCSEVCQGKGWYDFGHAHECSANPDRKRPHPNTSVVSSATEDVLRQKSARICKEKCISEPLAPKNALRVLDNVEHADTRYDISVATVPEARER
ncbi:hypothetical protein SARC_01767 [Sphaeroforma arctica JP610]|uniref:MYND-type domain-containing protein n=1 Tax=Sphaeroforma arctica JP610 TaxID=667725 RepID=A0A0L0GAS4_9EUKA|nr:hypothetical protein SARC_01767 [Sphaeroforma arctica JP610]KNC86075.1 hypothetical protein SARC_01767 [Sphaeroforma arctica JP610]|eukprot:XP_014159977.1 hypothetical protein SARC_01767 [Sphaeroforma arctica JP610]